MAELLKCFECGKPVSSQAWSCPHCGTKDFKGTKCCICRQMGITSQLKIKRKDKPNSYGDYDNEYYHESCLSSRYLASKVSCKRERGVCQVCSTPYITKDENYTHSSRNGFYYTVTCSNCGQNNYGQIDMTKVSVCPVCNHDVAIEKAVVIKDYLDGTGYVHPICYSQETLEELIEKNKVYHKRKVEDERVRNLSRIDEEIRIERAREKEKSLKRYQIITETKNNLSAAMIFSAIGLILYGMVTFQFTLFFLGFVFFLVAVAVVTHI